MSLRFRPRRRWRAPTRAAEDNTIARIIKPEKQRPPVRQQNASSTVSAGIMSVSTFVGWRCSWASVPPLGFGARAWDTWIHRALALLLISAGGAASDFGACIHRVRTPPGARPRLMKGAAIRPRRMQRAAPFDKTGTLTIDAATDVVGTTEEELLAIARPVLRPDPATRWPRNPARR